MAEKNDEQQVIHEVLSKLKEVDELVVSYRETIEGLERQLKATAEQSPGAIRPGDETEEDVVSALKRAKDAKSLLDRQYQRLINEALQNALQIPEAKDKQESVVHPRVTTRTIALASLLATILLSLLFYWLSTRFIAPLPPPQVMKHSQPSGSGSLVPSPPKKAPAEKPQPSN
ncbi:MAG: hypothetical protein HQK59_04860 [Deltaproteobacteria bacterium]|nr:hypothetical protein [Deltaproteobacteria bacterium]